MQFSVYRSITATMLSEELPSASAVCVLVLWQKVFFQISF